MWVAEAFFIGGSSLKSRSQTVYIDLCVQSLKVNSKITDTEAKVLLPCNGDKNALKLYFNFFQYFRILFNTTLLDEANKKQINVMNDI